MNIYYSHSVSEYNTQTEKDQLEIIKKAYPKSTIINPKDIPIKSEDKKLLKGNNKNYLAMMEKYFFKEIDKCDKLIAFDDTLTDGVIKEIEHAEKVNKPVIIKSIKDLQKDREEFYTKSNAYKFIENYFDIIKGQRSISCHSKIYIFNKQYYKRNYKNQLIKFTPDQYYYDKNKNNRRMMTLRKEHLIQYNCIHSFMYVFDEKVHDWYSNFDYDLDKLKIGINPILDLDSPYSIHPNRKDFFECIDEFNEAIDIIDKELNKIGEDYNIMFSGNGIYFLLEGRYDDVDIFKKDFVNLIDNLKKDKLGNNLKVHVDNKEAPWNDYFKIPFTFHEKKPRISCPLPKGELNKRWIKEHTDINKIKEDYTLVDEIIKEAKWSNLW